MNKPKIQLDSLRLYFTIQTEARDKESEEHFVHIDLTDEGKIDEVYFMDELFKKASFDTYLTTLNELNTVVRKYQKHLFENKLSKLPHLSENK